jgi:hypothetical protein
MSNGVLEQAKQLTSTLSAVEKVKLIEWLGAVLVQELSTQSIYRQANGSEQSVANPAPDAADDVPWEERPWTEEEIRLLMKPNPKTGAEIAAWLEANPDTGGWAEMDIPDVVEWVRELRRQMRPGVRWDE